VVYNIVGHDVNQITTVTARHTYRYPTKAGHMATPSIAPTTPTGRQTPRRSGTMSTAEIKSRIEAMFADDRRPTRPAVTN